MNSWIERLSRCTARTRLEGCEQEIGERFSDGRFFGPAFNPGEHRRWVAFQNDERIINAAFDVQTGEDHRARSRRPDRRVSFFFRKRYLNHFLLIPPVIEFRRDDLISRNHSARDNVDADVLPATSS